MERKYAISKANSKESENDDKEANWFVDSVSTTDSFATFFDFMLTARMPLPVLAGWFRWGAAPNKYFDFGLFWRVEMEASRDLWSCSRVYRRVKEDKTTNSGDETFSVSEIVESNSWAIAGRREWISIKICRKFAKLESPKKRWAKASSEIVREEGEPMIDPREMREGRRKREMES
jgi:hypothetical protein